MTGLLLYKNNLRIILGSKVGILKNDDAQKNLCHSYKNKMCIQTFLVAVFLFVAFILEF